MLNLTLAPIIRIRFIHEFNKCLNLIPETGPAVTKAIAIFYQLVAVTPCCLDLVNQLLYTHGSLKHSSSQHYANRHKSQQVWTVVIIHICSLVVQATHIPGMIQTADFMAKTV